MVVRLIIRVVLTQVTTVSILQVVKNPAWTTPYIACALVGFGMALHFIPKLKLHLLKNKRKDEKVVVIFNRFVAFGLWVGSRIETASAKKRF